jgi:membrane protein implicated in regulation of membrane protease activity
MHHRRWSWRAWALACLVGLAALAAVILAVWELPSLLYGDVTQASPDARLQAASSFRTALVAGLAGLAALGSLAMASRTYRLTQQSQITDRYTKAIEQLGSDKLDIRLGGIYALERIAVDSRRDHPTVVEVLGAFVRERSQPTEDGPGGSATDLQAAATVLGRLPQTGVARGNLAGARLAGGRPRVGEPGGRRPTRGGSAAGESDGCEFAEGQP